jgi:hypothetical protein
MAITSAGMVQTLQPPRPVNSQQAVETRDTARDESREREAAEAQQIQEPRRSAPEPGKGTRVDVTA